MSMLADFALRRPATLAEAAALLSAHPEARLLAGGTDLVANIRHGLDRPALLIDLGAVQALRELVLDREALHIGAGVSLAQLAADAAVLQDFPALAQAARLIAGPAHRVAGTVGGNLCLDTRCVFYNQSEWWRRSNHYCLKRDGETCHVAPQGKRCHAAYSGDLAPVLLVLEAELELVSRAGTRRVPLTALYRDDGARHLTLEHGEILVSVRVLRPVADLRTGYRKARVRGAMDFPLAGVAVALALDAHGRLNTFRLGLTGTNSYPLLLEGTNALIGRPADEAALSALGKLVQKQVSPMRTTVTASNYRRQVAAVLAQRLLRELAQPR
ncbi:MAG TPA: 4-hydroxybenzoyl-CoA reductase subunit beta [Burkholderiales bacterium]|nr:4-hydroxybenzoyl-CoA reductase subunit beta [Burkholderiales bacterium]